MKINTTLKVPKLNTTELLFAISLSLYLFVGILSTTFYFKYFAGTLHKGILLLCIFILLMKEVLDHKVKKAELFFVCLCGLMCCILFFSLGVMNDLICLFFFIYSARDVNFKKICSIALWVSMFTLFFVILSAKIGLIPNYVGSRANGIEREYLGFLYALYPASIVFNCIILYLYKNNKYKIKDIAFLVSISLYVFQKTNSRLTFFLGILLIIVLSLEKKFQFIFENKIIKLLMISSFVLCAVFSIYLTLIYSPSDEKLSAINLFFGNRLSIGQTSILRYGFSIWGNPNIEWIGNGLTFDGQKAVGTYLWVDCLYLQLFQRYGIVFLVAVLFLLTLLSIGAERMNDNKMLIILVFIAFHCMIDDLSMYLFYNTFWLASGYFYNYTFGRKKAKYSLASSKI